MSLLKKSKNPEIIYEGLESKLRDFFSNDEEASNQLTSIYSKSTQLNYQMNSENQSLSQVSDFSALSKSHFSASKTICKDDIDRVKKMTTMNYGHIAGGVVREFFKEVIPTIENRLKVKV